MGVYTLDDFRLGLAVLLGFSLMGLGSTLFVKETFCRHTAD